MNKFFILFLVQNIFFIFHINAQIGTNTTQGAASLGLANATVAVFDAYFCGGNPAALTHFSKRNLSIATENRLSITPLSIFALGVIMPTNSGTFGVNVQHFGFGDYREQQFAAAFGKKIRQNISLGVSFIGQMLQISTYGTATWAGFNVGLQADILKNLRLGILIESPFISELNEFTTLSSVWRIGAAYQASAKTMILLELEKRLLMPLRTKIAVSYNILENIDFRIGLLTNPSQITTGFSFRWSKLLNIDVAGASHTWLGLSSAIGLRYNF